MNMTHADDEHRCRDFLTRLSMYLDNDLTAGDRRRIETHLRGCPRCEDVLDSLRRTIALCHEQGRPDLPREIRQRARKRVVDILAAAKSHPKRRR